MKLVMCLAALAALAAAFASSSSAAGQAAQCNEQHGAHDDLRRPRLRRNSAAARLFRLRRK
jgi:hypothetical protein